MVHRDLPIATILPPSASRSPSPLLLPPPSALLPIWGWPGCCSEGSSHPRSCQWPPSFPWAEHTIEKGLRLRGSVAINPYQLFLPRVFCATIRAPEGALTSTNLAIVGQECWQKKRNFSCVHASVCIHVWEPRNVGLISIVGCEEGRPWRIPYLAAWQNSFALKWKNNGNCFQVDSFTLSKSLNFTKKKSALQKVTLCDWIIFSATHFFFNARPGKHSQFQSHF